jgi:TRAP-type C4-dicarboxylate transport system permease small subunit
MKPTTHSDASLPDAPTDGDNTLPTILERLSIGLACALLLVLTGITLLDVLGRDMFNKPLAGATELTELLLVGMTFLAYPAIAWRASHITVDLFDWFRSDALRRFQRMTIGLLGALAFGGLAWQLGTNGVRAEGYGDVTPSLGLHLSWALWFMALLSVITSIVFALRMFIAQPPPRTTENEGQLPC